MLVVVTALGSLIGLAACAPAPPPAPPQASGPDMAKISAAAREVAKVPFAELPATPIAPCELRRTEHVQVAGERGRSVDLKAPSRLSADNVKIFYAIYPAPDNLLADLAGIAQACHPRKVSQVVTPRQGKPFMCRDEVTTTAVMDGPILQVITDAVPAPAPPGGDWTTDEQGRLRPPPDLGQATCGKGVSYGQANLFAVKNGVAVQVVKPIDLAGVDEFDEQPATLGTAARTEAMQEIQKLLVALPS